MATWYEILKETLEPNMEIRYIEFIEDIVPKYLVLIVNDTQKHESFLQIKHIIKNQKYLEKKNLVKTNINTSNEAQFKEKKMVARMPRMQNDQGVERAKEDIEDSVQKGIIKKERRRSWDNYELIVNEKDNQDAMEKIAILSKRNQLSKIISNDPVE